MLTIFSRYLTLLLPAFTTLLLLILPIYAMSGYTVLFDFSTSLSASDAFLGTYYFWWTNMLYLPLFFFLTSTGFILNCWLNTNNWEVTALLLALYLCYPLELYDYLVSNQDLSISLAHTYGLNTLLTNVLNSYHPFIFYTSTFILFSYLFTFLYPTHATLKPAGARVPAYFQGVIINLIALWMGSWWALQEGTWGGWWNWDSSEVFGLLVTLLLLSFTHSIPTYASLPFLNLNALKSILLFLIAYFFIQLNFELVSHNFGSNFFFFFNNNLFFIEILAAASIWTIGLHVNSFNINTNSMLVSTVTWNLSSNKLHQLLLKILVPTVLMIWVLLSYKPLISYFLWNFMNLNLFNSEVSWQHLNLFLSLISIIWFLSYQSTLTVSLIVYAYVLSSWLLIPIAYFTLRQSVGLLHILIATLLVFNLLVFDVVLYNWATYAQGTFLYSSGYTVVGDIISSTLDNTAIEYVNSFQSHVTAVNLSWNISTVTNTPSLNFFGLTGTHDLFYNLYNLATLYTNVYLYIELPLIPSLNLSFWILLLLVLNQVVVNPVNSNF